MSITELQIQTDKVPAPAYQFSQGVRRGNVVQVSGQGGVDAGSPLDSTENGLAAQTVRALDNVRHILEAADASLGDAVMVRVYLSTRDHFAEMCEVYDRYVAEHVTGVLPARTTVFVGLPSPAMLIEIDALAVVSD
jgi:enamine deaminase RidA (YjgF/YER057c/UK114 family)